MSVFVKVLHGRWLEGRSTSPKDFAWILDLNGIAGLHGNIRRTNKGFLSLLSSVAFIYVL